MKYVGKLGRRKMPACDMIRFEHVKAIMAAGYAQVTRDYVLLFALGDVPSEMRPYAYGGRLVAPSKPGNDGHRPLGAGTAWRRVAAGFLCQMHRRAFADTLGPVQLGVGVPRGPEIFALAVQFALQAHDGAGLQSKSISGTPSTCARVRRSSSSPPSTSPRSSCFSWLPMALTVHHGSRA